MIATCPEQELLRRYASGMVSEEQADELTSHLRDCPSCQSWMADAEDLDDTLVASLRHSTVDESFELEPQCQSAMAIALGALAAANQADAEDLIDLPSSIGDYKIVRSIGRGGMGNVYLAQHTKLDRTVAVKVLASHRLSDPRMHDRFEKEMRSIGSLSHPNIVTAHDARDVDGVALLVTEWIDGLDLKDILGRMGPLSVANVCEIGARIAGALSYIAAQDQVHRDLKPSNVMINRDGEVKLLDLGLARLRASDAEQDVSAATATGQALGTADYVAPEQINDAREVDIRADIYGLGCTLYQLLSGRAPFEGDRYATVFAKLTAHVSEQPAPLRSVAPHVPPALASLIDQMLAKSPDDRPASPDKIVAALQKHAGGANLKSLVRSALAAEPSAQQVIAPSRTIMTQPFWKRRVPVAVAVASGLGGLILGWLAGVTITITHPDGSKIKVDVPRTSSIAIHENGDIDVDLDGTPVAAQAATSSDSAIDLSKLAPPDDRSRFEGVWRAEMGMNRGLNAPIADVEGMAMIFHEHDFVLMRRSVPLMCGQVKLESEITRIALTVLRQGNQPLETYKAIYRFFPDGKLQIVMPRASEQGFPESFELYRATDVSTVTLSKIQLDSDPTALAKLMQDPAGRDLLYSVAMYQSLQSKESSIEAITEAMQRSSIAQDATQSRNNLKQLGVAFHQYHDAYNAFPQSHGALSNRELNENEYPCSWRVAILPYIKEQQLFEQYNFKEPWDSEHNLKVLDKMPGIYRRPGDPADSTMTGYVGFVGDSTILGDSKPTKMRDTIDGTSNTVMLVEAETQIPWTKPEDFSLDDLASSGLLDKESLLVALADGSVAEMKPVTADWIKGVAIINDGKYFKDLPANVNKW